MQFTDTLQYWKTAADSGQVKGHGFWPVCGTPVSLGFEARRELIAVPAGSLDEPERFEPKVLTLRSRGWAWDAVPQTMQTFERMPTG